MSARKSLFWVCAAAVLAVATPAKALIFNTHADAVFSHPFGSLFDTKSAFGKEATGIPFNRGLYDGYIELSDDRASGWWRGNWDFYDGELFNHKARAAYRNSSVMPESPMDRDLSDEEAMVFQVALERLRNGFDRGGRYEAAADAAKAQVSFDCWIEATEASRDSDIERCKAAFEAAMKEVELFSKYKLTEVRYIEAPKRAAAPAAQPSSYLVYFEFDKTDILAEGRAALAAAIRDAKGRPNTQVRLVAHADRSGELNYNQALSERRATVVIGALISGGINPERIISEAVGERKPLVPTADGVREQGNRVVEIDLL
jgi:OOP family OmpA-OmpF porin